MRTTVEIGYFIVPARWGQGLATEAAIAVRDEAFGRVGLYELIGRSRVENTASARVMAKAGFRHVRSYTLEEGATVDIHRISRDEWIEEPPRHAAAQHEAAAARDGRRPESGVP